MNPSSNKSVLLGENRQNKAERKYILVHGATTQFQETMSGWIIHNFSLFKKLVCL